MSQPRPVPCLSMSSLNVEISLTRTMSNSCARVTAKCSHRAVLTSRPSSAIWFSMSFLTKETHEPQLVPALVHCFTAAMSVHWWSVTAPRIVPAVTLLHEHTLASSGSELPLGGSMPSGSSHAVGSLPRARPTMGRRFVYALASPTSMPPSNVWASSLMTSFL